MSDANLSPAPDEFYARAARLIADHHPHLAHARIEINVRERVRRDMNHNSAWAEVDTPNNDADKARFDFTLWFALEAWGNLTELQRDALMDHELTHCGYDEDGAPWLAPHDLEEFYAILARYGAWWPDRNRFLDALALMPPAGQEGAGDMPTVTEFQRAMPGNGGSRGGATFQVAAPGNGGSRGGATYGADNVAWSDPSLTAGGDYYELPLGNGQVLQVSAAAYRAIADAVLTDMGGVAV